MITKLTKVTWTRKNWESHEPVEAGADMILRVLAGLSPVPRYRVSIYPFNFFSLLRRFDSFFCAAIPRPFYSIDLRASSFSHYTHSPWLNTSLCGSSRSELRHYCHLLPFAIARLRDDVWRVLVNSRWFAISTQPWFDIFHSASFWVAYWNYSASKQTWLVVVVAGFASVGRTY
jgi:hypothetical protein